MNDVTYKLDVTKETFEQVVIKQSLKMPVLVDFWADWCGPCKMLMPILDKIAQANQGKLFLAKVNSDEQGELAAHFQVRSLPTVKLFKNGQVVDEFMGARSETDVYAFLAPHLNRDSDTQLTQAIELLKQDQVDQALSLLENTYQQDPGNTKLASQLALLYLQRHNTQAAEAIYRDMDGAHRSSKEGEQLAALIQLSQERDALMDAETAIDTLREQPTNAEALYRYSIELVFKHQFVDAMTHLLNLMQSHRSYRDDAAHKALILVFKIVGEQDPTVIDFRKKMTRLLY